MSLPPIIDGEPPEDKDTRLIALFDELEKGQLTFLDEAAKRILELTTGLLAVLFAVVAFGSDFPPPYLKDNLWTQVPAILTLLLYVSAMLCAVVAVQPRDYRYYQHNLTRLREELKKITDYKSMWFRSATICFFVASLCLTALILAVIFAA